MEDKLQELYQEFGQDFCLCPFLGGFYQTNSVVYGTKDTPKNNNIRPCCAVSFDHKDAHWDVVDSSLLKSRNTDRWKHLRKEFVEGRYRNIEDCRVCIEAEDSGGASARQGANRHFLQHSKTDVFEEVRSIIANNYESNKIVALDYFPSPYCNFACIMCAPGASTGRLKFETDLKRVIKLHLNDVDADFYSIMQDVEILNFTGGETQMQQQVLELIDYLVDRGLSKNKTIFFLTNASKFPYNLIDKFRQFYKTIYLFSLDGVGSTIEYQRRGCNWEEVSENIIKFNNHEFIDSVGNCVVTAVNAPNLHQLIDWIAEHKIRGVTMARVFRTYYLDVCVMPQPLRQLTLDRLQACREKHAASSDPFISTTVINLIDQCITIIDNTPFNNRHYIHFKYYIKLEDKASKVKLADAVPEWAPYL